MRYRRAPKRMFEASAELTSGEILVLRAMVDGRWHSAQAVGELTGLAPFAIRSILKELVRRRLAARSFHTSTADQLSTWSLTAAGQLEATAQEVAARG